ncbi:uncharacterized protein LOC141609220 [Silene latifolia]|uniref:uncharacterized protein LOC141609220 n=1 Tax=Silene latifolia TaxID=37657 RepID=UPI003D783B34
MSTTSSNTSHATSPTTSPKQASPTSTTSSTHGPTTATASTITSSPTKTQAAIETLSSILPTPLSISSSLSAAFLLNSPDVSAQISTLLRHPTSGSGDNQLCRWLYDTFQSSDPSLQLVVLRFIPLISGMYLTRITQRKPLAGFEAVLLALYAHETTARDGQATSVTIPDLCNPSIYHESSSNAPTRANNSTDLNIAVISPSLEPHGTVRSTRRARIVGVALELFHSKIWVMPVESKIDFCEFFEIWTGQVDIGKANNGDKSNSNSNTTTKKLGRIPLAWELLQPCLRILGHCLLSEDNNCRKNNSTSSELYEKARSACKCLYVRAMHDVNPKAILAAGSLLKIIKLEEDLGDFDPTEITTNRIISV